MKMLKLTKKLFIFILLPFLSKAVQVKINNLQPRYDTQGMIIDAHDGSIQHFEKNGVYYMHAMQYGLCQEPPNYGCDGVRTMFDSIE